MELGIRNAAQGVVFDLLTRASQWATPSTIHNVKYYWVARQVICTELPFFCLQPDTVYRHLKDLEKLGLIHYEKLGKKDCIRITNKAQKSVLNAMSENNPKRYVGNKSESNSENNPTYLTTSINQERDIHTQDFESFFTAFPRNNKPDLARQEYAFVISQGASHKQIMASLKTHLIEWRDREERYIPYAGNWLASGDWKNNCTKGPKSLKLIVGKKLTRSEMKHKITSSVLDVNNTNW